MIDRASSGDPAAVIVEFVLGSGGIIPVPGNRARQVRQFCDEHGALLIADEALTGLGRLGASAEHALISLLALNGLRVSEAAGADIEPLGVERGHRTLVITRKGGKVVTHPARAAHRPGDRPGHRRALRRTHIPGPRRPPAGPARRRGTLPSRNSS
jgi:integrase